jgi:hypothetical protein
VHTRREVLQLMLKRYASFLTLLFAFLPLGASAQDSQPTVTRTSRILSHVDFGLSGTVLLTKDVTGTVNQSALGAPYSVTQSSSTSAGFLFTIRAQKSPYKGLEFNYGHGRTTQGYTCCNVSPTDGTNVGPFQSQSGMSEFTLGYLVRPPHKIFGFQPYVSAGAGSTEFTPTANGGQGLKSQARATYYYSVGLEDSVTSYLGIRAGLRQAYYKAPDFGQNYLTINKLTFTTEPQVGIYFHF